MLKLSNKSSPTQYSRILYSVYTQCSMPYVLTHSLQLLYLCYKKYKNHHQKDETISKLIVHLQCLHYLFCKNLDFILTGNIRTLNRVSKLMAHYPITSKLAINSSSAGCRLQSGLMPGLWRFMKCIVSGVTHLALFVLYLSILHECSIYIHITRVSTNIGKL